MEREEGSNGGRSCYYSVLGVRRDASSADIRSAYRKLALVLSLPSSIATSELFLFFSSISVIVLMLPWVFSRLICLSLLKKWHPDRWASNPSVAGEAKRRFQQIQEAYSGFPLLFSFNWSRNREFVHHISWICVSCGNFAVLSDKGKRSMYDAGFYDPTEEEDQVTLSFSLPRLLMILKFLSN